MLIYKLTDQEIKKINQKTEILKYYILDLNKRKPTNKSEEFDFHNIVKYIKNNAFAIKYNNKIYIIGQKLKSDKEHNYFKIKNNVFLIIDNKYKSESIFNYFK